MEPEIIVVGYITPKRQMPLGDFVSPSFGGRHLPVLWAGSSLVVTFDFRGAAVTSCDVVDSIEKSAAGCYVAADIGWLRGLAAVQALRGVAVANPIIALRKKTEDGFVPQLYGSSVNVLDLTLVRDRGPWPPGYRFLAMKFD